MKYCLQDVAKTGHFQLRSRLKSLSTSFSILQKEKLQAGLMCSDYLSPSFGSVSWPRCLSWFLASAGLNRIRGARDFNSVNLYQQQPVFISSLRVFFPYVQLHIVINSVHVQNLPTEQATSVVTGCFSWGYYPYTHACKARPLTTVGRTSLSVIIIIIIIIVCLVLDTMALLCR